jgi:hypothetical protein
MDDQTNMHADPGDGKKIDLNHLKPHNIHQVPEGYFEQSGIEIKKKTMYRSEEASVDLSGFLWKKYALPGFVIVLLLLVSTYLFFVKPEFPRTVSELKKSQKVVKQMPEKKFQNEDQKFKEIPQEKSKVKAETIPSESTASVARGMVPVPEISIDALIAGMDENEIVKYLDDSEIEELQQEEVAFYYN